MTDEGYRPSQNYLKLGDAFYDRVQPSSFPEATIRFRNKMWSNRVGLGGLSETEWVDHFAHFTPLPGGLPEPLALRYHGHQFGTYNPELGDGRGFLFAQLHDVEDDRLLDLATKGTGPTPWSRGGDGKLTLQGGVREILATEMLEAQGVYTSKSFSLIETGESLHRGDEPSPTRSSVLVRLGHSHIRFGTFQRLAALGDQDNIEKLLSYAIDTYAPHFNDTPQNQRMIAYFDHISQKQAELAAQWTVAGFVHGVLNTDNININGESFDYGPWRFLPTYQPEFTAAYFDETQRYAFGKQPNILYWNLMRLAETLLHLAPQEKFETILEKFSGRFNAALGQNLCRRLGLKPQENEKNQFFSDHWFRFLHQSQIPFEQAFFDWYGGASITKKALNGAAKEHYAAGAFEPLLELLQDFEPIPSQNRAHTYFDGERPCTLRIEEVRALWASIHEKDDWAPLNEKLANIRQMGTAYGVYAA